VARPKGTALTRDDIVRAAVEVVRAEGPEALGIHRVAREVGIQAPSLYNHVRSKEDLERLVSIEVNRRLGEALATARKRSPGEPIAAMCAAYRAFAKREPRLYALAARVIVPPGDPELAPVLSAALAPLQEALAPSGLTGDEAIHAIRTMRAALHGFTLLETSGSFGMRQKVDESFEWLVAALVRALQRQR
jgi:AcrR family transcriptional regulator